MSSIAKLAQKVKSDFGYTFSEGDDFRWSPDAKIITHPAIIRLEHIWSLLHEISHGELGHTTFDADISLLTMESLAWDKAKKLAGNYGLHIDEAYIQDHLDSYRFWLHKRSQCPNCGQNGIQSNTKIYSCIHCRFLWRTNEARLCELRRFKLQAQADHE